jgi:hypothetical protein
MSQHTVACWAMPDCTVCGRRKAPRGRSVPLEAATGYCTTGGECRGYGELPYAGHFWPEEEPELRAALHERKS